MAARRFTRTHLLWLLGAVVIAALGWYLAGRIEWVEVEIQLPPKDEAARDNLYATKAMVRRLGAHVVTRENFASMPPPGATLFLASSHWNMFEGRDVALHRWVEAGGNLVLGRTFFGVEESGQPTWHPFEWKPLPKRDAASAPSAASAVLAALPRALRDVDADCHEIRTRDPNLPPFEGHARYRFCGGVARSIAAKAPIIWAVDGEHGHEFISARVGAGRVSATSAWNFYDNENALRGDNPLLIAALLNLHAGDPVWFVSEEKRDPVVLLLWRRGWPAVLLGALALAFALWRSGVRFGPRLATAAKARRSIVEQIIGTARFIANHDGQPLHRAELRALDEAAITRIANYRALVTQRERADAIGKATKLDADELAAAMDRTVKRTPRALASVLVVIEHARRALIASGRSTAPSTSPPPPAATPDSPVTKDSA